MKDNLKINYKYKAHLYCTLQWIYLEDMFGIYASMHFLLLLLDQVF